MKLQRSAAQRSAAQRSAAQRSQFKRFKNGSFLLWLNPPIFAPIQKGS